MVALAAAAGVVIENARLAEEQTRREDWLRATAEITGALVEGTDRLDTLQTLVDAAREVASADVALVTLRRRGDDQLQVPAASADRRCRARRRAGTHGGHVVGRCRHEHR